MCYSKTHRTASIPGGRAKVEASDIRICASLSNKSHLKSTLHPGSSKRLLPFKHFPKHTFPRANPNLSVTRASRFECPSHKVLLALILPVQFVVTGCQPAFKKLLRPGTPNPSHFSPIGPRRILPCVSLPDSSLPLPSQALFGGSYQILLAGH